jgi:hypothetical protein
MNINLSAKVGRVCVGVAFVLCIVVGLSRIGLHSHAIWGLRNGLYPVFGPTDKLSPVVALDFKDQALVKAESLSDIEKSGLALALLAASVLLGLPPLLRCRPGLLAITIALAIGGISLIAWGLWHQYNWVHSWPHDIQSDRPPFDESRRILASSAYMLLAGSVSAILFAAFTTYSAAACPTASREDAG